MPAANPKKNAPAAKRAPAIKKPDLDETANVDNGAAATTPDTLRLKGLIERVAASTGGKTKGLKEIVEATLAQLGLALQNGEMLNLPELGKVRVAKVQGTAPGSAMTLKLRSNSKMDKTKSADVALAEPADHS